MFKRLFLSTLLAASAMGQLNEVLNLVSSVAQANPMVNAAAIQQKVGTFFTALSPQQKAQDDAEMNTDAFWTAKWGAAPVVDAPVQMAAPAAPVMAVFAPSADEPTTPPPVAMAETLNISAPTNGTTF
ncbi:hypothetical protein SDRG_10197 [Saprolegnia diclina VS20]|uniref:Uncharacterized protein n=1 Tax=Saprolegnia diclina (strain VS20) TaxID=1156394 RepID=T0RPU4_SAPDV|nr:hypothetical protein SDRG_10197 [Saprolegnia diclina VS20]EQC31997.1 hypothetical protein SDRG_10197 [Saprolegnia diclina VS20]|eukprot:XP_008614399.1 hypothetical protein SDRG_10197 [Saprolegnia diclina VS20]